MLTSVLDLRRFVVSPRYLEKSVWFWFRFDLSAIQACPKAVEEFNRLAKINGTEELRPPVVAVATEQNKKNRKAAFIFKNVEEVQEAVKSHIYILG